MRADTARNRRTVMEAYEQLAYANDDGIDIATISRVSGVSVASIYRYYGSLDGLADSFRKDLIQHFVSVANQLDATEHEYLKNICEAWWNFVNDHSKALISSRSKKGYLTRLLNGSPDIVPVAECINRGIQDYAVKNDIAPDPNLALYEWNKEFDPRDIRDLIDNTKYLNETLFELTYNGFVNKLATKCLLLTTIE